MTLIYRLLGGFIPEHAVLNALHLLLAETRIVSSAPIIGGLSSNKPAGIGHRGELDVLEWGGPLIVRVGGLILVVLVREVALILLVLDGSLDPLLI